MRPFSVTGIRLRLCGPARCNTAAAPTTGGRSKRRSLGTARRTTSTKSRAPAVRYLTAGALPRPRPNQVRTDNEERAPTGDFRHW